MSDRGETNGDPTWLTDEVRGAIHEQLPQFLRGRRWFAGKARTVDAVRIVDETSPGTLPGTTVLALVEVGFRDGAADAYFMPLGMATGDAVGRLAPGAEIARVAGTGGPAVVYDALFDDATCAALLDAIALGWQTPTRAGRILATTTAAFGEARGPADADLAVRRGSAEQSNSNILYGDRLLLKVFRRLEPGRNPDLEIGRFLSERTDFDRIPRTAGALEYERPGADPVTLAILQGLVANQGTGWEHALHVLAAYYDRVAAPGGPPASADVAGRSPLEVAAAVPPPVVVEQAIGDYLLAAATLGRRTAELHLALASVTDDPSFAPEPLMEADLRALARGVREQVETSLNLLRASLDRLSGPVARQAQRVLEETPDLLELLVGLPALTPGSTKIRLHGDYHLGQVLRVGDDFVILDFEGEPARPLARRREKQTPLKDVVGMLRSFDYAAYAGLFASAQDRPGEFERLEPWAQAWQGWTSAAFLRQYLATAAGAAFLPDEPGVISRLLRAFSLDKALYELLYELNNRPDWVRIPLQGILALLEHGSGGPTAPEGGSSP